MKSTIERIAKKHFDVETMDTRNRDRLDFYDCGIWSIKAALEEAYKCGQKSVSQDNARSRQTDG
ncbi:MAG: hypothetical protein CML13_06825 [Puniceicoccaceae bacterium]|nr:hypothetical protein [Puniceicoccaceae bacterium]|tara:strand:- start:499 stop:690 length:192 start_codon:yes stop_codon:yes gene_type:complete